MLSSLLYFLLKYLQKYLHPYCVTCQYLFGYEYRELKIQFHMPEIQISRPGFAQGTRSQHMAVKSLAYVPQQNTTPSSLLELNANLKKKDNILDLSTYSIRRTRNLPKTQTQPFSGDKAHFSLLV